MNNINNLIKEYGEITGREKGWEKYLTIEDYLKFKAAAVNLSDAENKTVDIDSSDTENISRPYISNSEEKKNKNKEKEEKTAENNNIKNKKINTINQKSEIDIFKEMGEE